MVTREQTVCVCVFVYVSEMMIFPRERKINGKHSSLIDRAYKWADKVNQSMAQHVLVYSHVCMHVFTLYWLYVAAVLMCVSFVQIYTYSPTCVCVCVSASTPARVFMCFFMSACVCVCFTTSFNRLTQWPSLLGGLASCCCPPTPPGSQGETECEVVCLATLQWLITVQKRPLELASWAAQQASREAGIHRLCCGREREQ